MGAGQWWDLLVRGWVTGPGVSVGARRGASIAGVTVKWVNKGYLHHTGHWTGSDTAPDITRTHNVLITHQARVLSPAPHRTISVKWIKGNTGLCLLSVRHNEHYLGSFSVTYLCKYCILTTTISNVTLGLA